MTSLPHLLLLLPLLLPTHGFYVPGVAPTDFKEGELIEVKAVKMTSAHTQVWEPVVTTNTTG